MVLLVLFLFASHTLTSDQSNLITKLPDEIWTAMHPKVRQQILEQAEIIRRQIKEIENLKKEIHPDPLSNAMRYILKPDCRNDLK